MPSSLLNSRAVFLLLLLANLAFLAWAVLIDQPPAPPPRSASASHLPKLVLVSEARAAAARAAVQPSGGAVASPPAGTAQGAATAGPAPSTSSSTTPAAAPGAAGTSAPAAAAGTTDAAASPALASTQAHCVTVGPFNELTRAAQGAELLRRRGFSPRQRAEEGEPWSGFWVYVGGLTSEAQQSDVLRRLKRNGIQDAQPLPESEGQRRVSVGLFSERAGAESRAKAVRHLGFTAEIVEHKQAAAAYWVDLDLATSNQTLPMEGLLSLEESGARLEIRECPGRAAPAAPAAPASSAARTAQAQPAR